MKHPKTLNLFWDLFKIVLPAVVGFALAYITFNKEYDATEKARLNDNMNKLLDVDLQYPFLEDSVYIAHWAANKNAHNDSALRYQTYCTYLFNTLEDVCEYYHYSKIRIDRYMDVSDLIEMHKAWWDAYTRQNTASYGPEFVSFVSQYYVRSSP